MVAAMRNQPSAVKRDPLPGIFTRVFCNPLQCVSVFYLKLS